MAEEKSIRTRVVVAIVLAAGFLAGACSNKTSDNTIQYVGVGELSKWLARSPEKYLVVDTRSPEQFVQGRIPGARRLTLPDVDEENPDPALGNYSAIVVYGQDPSSGVAKAMTKRLIKSRVNGSVYLLEGGMAAWRGSGGPVSGARDRGEHP